MDEEITKSEEEHEVVDNLPVNARQVGDEILLLCPHCNRLFHPDRIPDIGR